MNATIGIESQRLLEDERLRISRDIHDDLGARLTEMVLLSDLAQRHRDRADQVEAHIGRLSAIAREVVRDLDSIIWSVNPRNDFLDSLGNYILSYAERYLGMAAIRCRVDVPEDLPHWPLSSHTRQNLFMVVKEALNNIVKHSKASEVRLQLRMDDSFITLTIEDDGQGFLGARAQARGNGLQNMEKRIRDLGGRFELLSQLGHGTQVKLRLRIREVSEDILNQVAA
jgi:signal transduction histidine kinase